ncbi:MAG: gliding motility-associated C-terminal domain-containing protein [Bacteroidales bacterium]|nr:gliding motility-associated C-terminal domain-containing protein [Bacteroidales bacterium]
MKQFLLSIFFCMISVLSVYATHERAGEITYRHISGLTYEVTITTYTYSLSPADREELLILWGDGTSENIPRKSKQLLPHDIQRNTYLAQHTYPSMGSYTLSMEDANRNSGIVNIPNSVNIPFYIETKLIINPFLQYNNSPRLTNPPIDAGCTGVPFYHNPAAVDPDGDSLVYSLIPCRGYSGEIIPGYAFPHAPNSISVNAQTGDFYWDYPMTQGEYNIAILVEEYRLGVKVGEVVRDMQITISGCDNRPPEITAIRDTCIDAGDTLAFQVTATDNISQIVTLSAYGDAVETPHNPAVFQSVPNYGTATGSFVWNTECAHVRKQPYQVTFKAVDNHAVVSLTSIKTVRITIVAPAPQNLQAIPFQNTIQLSWLPTPCNHAIGYKIYRRMNSSGFVPDHCETGVPAYTGYTQIGTTNMQTTSFTDDNNGQGLLRGNLYCYLVIAYFGDMAESYASNEACTYLQKDVPIITNVSIQTTDNSSGKINIRWIKPVEIDTVQYPGPYSYTIERSINNASTFTTLATYSDADSAIFTDSLQNTQQNTFFYRIGFYNNTSSSFLIGRSDAASSVFLSIDSADRRLTLSWKTDVPWSNYQYIVYRESNTGFDSIGQTTLASFTDTGLINGQSYCYYVEAVGAYSDSVLPNPLINLSQIVCAQAWDNTPPCTPVLQGNSDCENIYLQWSFADTCPSDASLTYIYAKNTLADDYFIYDSVFHPTLSYTIAHPASIAGCFFVVAVDSNGNQSSYSNELCFDIDLCDAYRLPNYFSPNGDGANDLFRPYPYNFVESIDMHIFDRWGVLMFKTTNPDVLWDGTNQFTKQNCVAGVYYYVCNVREYTLNGIRTRYLNGSITLFR